MCGPYLYSNTRSPSPLLWIVIGSMIKKELVCTALYTLVTKHEESKGVGTGQQILLAKFFWSQVHGVHAYPQWNTHRDYISKNSSYHNVTNFPLHKIYMGGNESRICSFISNNSKRYVVYRCSPIWLHFHIY